MALPPAPRAVLLDLAGVLHDGPQPIPGAINALKRLRQSGLPLRFLTNTTRTPRHTLVSRLQTMGFAISVDEVDTAAHASLELIHARGLCPHFLVHPGLDEEVGPSSPDPDTLVIGDAGERFTFESLNTAFALLMRGCHFIAMANNRYYQAEGRLQLDTGAFVAALEYASGRQAEVVGKPAAPFFQAALHALGVSAEEAVFIGDDVRDDVGGAQAAGLKAILVQTGKYRPGDESRHGISPDGVTANLTEAVDLLLSGR